MVYILGFDFLETFFPKPLEELISIPMQDYFFQHEEKIFNLIEEI